MSSIKPPITSVCSACMVTVVCVSRVEIWGSPLVVPLKLLTVGCKVTLMKLPALTIGVMSSDTPV